MSIHRTRKPGYVVILFLLTGCVTQPVYSVDATKSALIKPIFSKDHTPYFGFMSPASTIVVSDLFQAQVVDITKSQPLRTITYPTPGIELFSISAQRNLLLQGVRPAENLWDLNTGKLLQTIKETDRRRGKNSVLSPDGQYAFINNRIWDLQKNKPVIELPGDRVESTVVFSPDNHFFALGGPLGTQVADLVQNKTYQFRDQQEVADLMFGKDNRIYQSYGFDMRTELNRSFPRYLSVLQPGQEKPIANYTPGAWITCWTVLADNTVFVALSNKHLLVLDANLKPLRQWETGLMATSCVSGKQQSIWLGTDDSGLYYFNPTLSRPIQKLPYTNIIESLRLSEDGRYLGIISIPIGDRRLEIYSTADLQK